MKYKNLTEACKARDEFLKEYETLLEKYGAEFWENDSCAGSGYSFQYLDSTGNIQTLY